MKKNKYIFKIINFRNVHNRFDRIAVGYRFEPRAV